MFDTWADRITAVTEEDGRRALVAEIALWRARKLADVPAAREGTWALARLHTLLADKAAAIREAKQLLSLCQTTPPASREEIQEARRLLADLGEKAPKVEPADDRPRRDARPERAERPARREGGRADAPRSDRNEARDSERRDRDGDPLADARDAAALGHTRKVRKLIGDRRGGAWSALRAWSLLVDGLAAPDTLAAAAQQAADELAGMAGVRAPRAPAADPKAASPLAALLGRELPAKRRAAIQALEDHVAAHPDSTDAVAAAALATFAADKGSVSWLASVVGIEIARGGEATRAKLAELIKGGTTSVAAFDTLPFHRAVRLTASALAAGWTFDGLREGVLDAPLWTLRLGRADGQRLLASAPHRTEPTPAGVAAVAERVAQLSPSAVLLATGVGLADLRDAATAHGLLALDEDADDAALLELLAGRAGQSPSRPRGDERPDAPASADDGPAPPDALAALLATDPTPEAVAALVPSFRRPSSALRVAERNDAPLRLAPALLRAVHDAATDPRPIPEGTTLAVRAAAARVPGARELLVEGDTAARFGGVGAADVADVAAAAADDGWELYRVLRGTTRRERDAQPALDTLGDSLDGLWRLLVRRGEVKGEIWFIASLPPEGRAGVPILLQEAHQRAVVTPIDPGLLVWYGSLGGPAAIGWTGAEADALRAALGAWVA